MLVFFNLLVTLLFYEHDLFGRSRVCFRYILFQFIQSHYRNALTINITPNAFVFSLHSIAELGKSTITIIGMYFMENNKHEKKIQNHKQGTK